MDADRRNDTGIFRYTDVEYTPEGHTDAYRWDDFLGIAGGEHPAMSEGVRADMRRFLEAYESDPVDPKALKIKGVGAQQVVEVLKSVYLR